MPTISNSSGSTRPTPLWLLLLLLTTISAPETGLASKEAPDPARAKLLALGEYDSDDGHKTNAHRDSVLLLNSEGELVRQIPRPSKSQGYGGCRGLSASRDGRFFVICGHSEEGLSMYRTSNRVKLWSLAGFFRSAVFADGMIYAVGPGGVYAIDHTGTIVSHSRVGGGIDIAFDPLGKSLWIVGMNIKRYTLDLRLLFKVRLPFSAPDSGAFSVDLNPDGSVWVAGRNPYEREGDGNKLVKISPAGRVLRVIHLDFCPQRVRVDISDGSVWTTGRVRQEDYSRIGDAWPETVAELDELVEVGVQTYTCKYDSEGELLLKSAEGGTSIEVDPSDGSVWITDGKSMSHYSSTGAKLATCAGLSGRARWLAIVP